MNIEQQLELAKRVYPEFEWRYNITSGIKGFKYVTNGDARYISEEIKFSPSLTGSPEQKSQALDVIVAAFNLSGNVSLYKINTAKGVYFQVIHGSDPGLLQEDPLTAASLALLGRGGDCDENRGNN
jgi:hypothetical protein